MFAFKKVVGYLNPMNKKKKAHTIERRKTAANEIKKKQNKNVRYTQHNTAMTNIHKDIVRAKSTYQNNKNLLNLLDLGVTLLALILIWPIVNNK